MIDRPLGSAHPKYADIVYEVNYGYLESYFSADGEELDVYLLGVNEAVESFEAEIIGVIYRKNDVEDKLVAAPRGMRFLVEDIEKATYFQEKFFETEIKALPIKEKKHDR
jgi:inorganic pyrophosphatase